MTPEATPKEQANAKLIERLRRAASDWCLVRDEWLQTSPPVPSAFIDGHNATIDVLLQAASVLSEVVSALRVLAAETGCADPDCCQAAMDLDGARRRALALLARLDGEAQSADSTPMAEQPGKP